MYDSMTTIEKFLAAAAAKQPTPGGGAVTALVGALAASMGEMVANYSVGRKGAEAFDDEMRPALAELTRARGLLLQLMVEDQLAYDAYKAARKLKPDSPEWKEKFPASLLICIRVPESIAATGASILELCDRLVGFANPWLLSDLAVCADLAMASIRCAIYSVRANLKELTDEQDRQAVEARIGAILSRSLVLIQSVAPRIWNRYDQG